MPGRNYKILRRIIIAILCFIIGGFFLNLFLASRLENYLRTELGKIVSQSTNGFYQLEFQVLDIGLFNGNLEMQGITFHPDSAVFENWKAKDSLPQTYFDFTLDKIHFKGINLVWTFNYNELNFDLFELLNPQVSIYQSNYSDNTEDNRKYAESKTLYELISPYIDVLTVKQINFENAGVIFNSGERSNPTVYQLQDANFHAYGFRLDENSYSSGKLLYSENFEFTTNQSQTLLANNQFILHADKIYVNTSDSLLKIDKINMIPQKMLWAQTNQPYDSYVDADIQSVEARGIGFNREDSRNNLNARTFDVRSSEIHYYATSKQEKTASPAVPDSIMLTWSLYSLIEPIFNSISVDNVSINDAKMSYTIFSGEDTDVYSMESFNFQAFGFRVDSIADTEKKFLYTEDFDLDANFINGTVTTQNHAFTVDKMYLETQDGNFKVKGIKLWPISTRSDNDYMRGTLDSLSITDVTYEKGFVAKKLSIDAPKLEYVKMPPQRTQSPGSAKDTIGNSDSRNVLRVLMSFIDLVSVEKFELNKGNITFRDRSSKEEMIYKVPRINFFADNVLLNEQSINNSPSFVTYDNYGFRFENFDNLLAGKEYRLKVKSGYYTGLNGNLELKGVELIPQYATWKQAPDTYLSFSTPLIQLRGIDYVLGTTPDSYGIASMEILSPHADIVKVRNNSPGKQGSSTSNNIPQFKLGNLHLSDLRVNYKDLTSKDTTGFIAGDISLKNILLKAGPYLSVGEILLDNPQVNIKKKLDTLQNNSKASSPSNTFEGTFDIGRLSVSNMNLGLDQPDTKLKIQMPGIDIRNVRKNNSALAVSYITLDKPFIELDNTVDSRKIKVPDSEEDEGGFYDALLGIAGQISVGRFDLSGARINYTNTLNGRTVRQQEVNSTSFDFTGLTIDATSREFNVNDFNFSTKNLNLPVSNGFYTMQIGEIDLHKENRSMVLNKLHMIPAYPKEEFAYHHPDHKDWFDVKVGRVELSEIDYPTYFSNQILNIKDARVYDVDLLNFKNQKIEIEHNVMPMIYENLQKAPLKLNIDNLDVKNFLVLYEELPKKGDNAGKIFFTEMNGKFTGLTNVVTRQNQYIRLDADGKFMGKGDFDAVWMLPVDSLNDNFLLVAKLKDFELSELNQLIGPLASAAVNRGTVDSLILKTEASSKGATVQMRLIYNNLDFTIYRNNDFDDPSPNSFITGVASMIVKKDNPDNGRKYWREPYFTLERDPYHSTFNYLWQIIQPPLVESVGVSQRTQNFFKGVSGFFNKVKNFFTGGGKKENEKKDDSE